MEVGVLITMPQSSGRPPRASSRFRRVVVAATSTAVITIGSPLAVANASAKPDSQQVLHYFSKFESQAFLTAAGKPFTPSEKNQPVPGDAIESTNLDYVGNHVHHAPNWTASDHELCIIDDKGAPVCHAQVAVGGSMILAQDTFPGGPNTPARLTFEVTGGTGTFQGVTGTIVVVNIDPSAQTDNSDVSITLNRP
jgi:hypothetical protein